MAKKPAGSIKKPLVVLLIILAFVVVVWLLAIALKGAGIGKGSECDQLGMEKYGEAREQSGEYLIERDYFYGDGEGKCLGEITVSDEGGLVRYAIVDLTIGETLIGYDRTCVGNYVGNQYKYAPADGPCITLDEYKAKKKELK